MDFIEWLRVIVLGIVEGVTEWLPISSTGHLIILNSIWKGNPEIFTEEFITLFDVVIQLGAIMAVVTAFFHKLNPISAYKTPDQKKNTWILWTKIVVAILPAVVFGFFLDDWMDEHLYKWYVVAGTLIFYGLAFIGLEIELKKRAPHILRLRDTTYKHAFLVGLFQCLAMVPGTSRSGVTIIGALLLGCSRYVATEFTFYLAIPVMFGASVLKLFKYFFIKELSITGTQGLIIAVASIVAYIVSMFIVKFLVKYVKRHDFKVFGYYRIALGILLIILSCVGIVG